MQRRAELEKLISKNAELKIELAKIEERVMKMKERLGVREYEKDIEDALVEVTREEEDELARGSVPIFM